MFVVVSTTLGQPDTNSEKQATHPQPPDEQEEVAMVVEADAVVDPRAVVVHVHHTLLAKRAVVSSDGFL